MLECHLGIAPSLGLLRHVNRNQNPLTMATRRVADPSTQPGDATTRVAGKTRDAGNDPTSIRHRAAPRGETLPPLLSEDSSAERNRGVDARVRRPASSSSMPDRDAVR